MIWGAISNLSNCVAKWQRKLCIFAGGIGKTVLAILPLLTLRNAKSVIYYVMSLCHYVVLTAVSAAFVLFVTVKSSVGHLPREMNGC